MMGKDRAYASSSTSLISRNIFLVLIRRGPRILAVCFVAFVIFLTTLYFLNNSNDLDDDLSENSYMKTLSSPLSPLFAISTISSTTRGTTSKVAETSTDPNDTKDLSELDEIVNFDSLNIYPTLDFNVTWTKEPQYFWTTALEKRFHEQYEKNPMRPPLKIIVVCHSHSDPGWGWTMEEYYDMRTKSTFKSALTQMLKFPKMKFLWSEASFLDVWWKNEGTRADEKVIMKNLVAEGRVEIVTGGWVMTDEASVNLYSMIDQLVEGQHWVNSNLNVLPENGWSVDPFGHGPVVPYLLKNSGFENMVILRIHYAWKKWLAERQAGDFYWGQRFDDHTNQNSILCHQHPYFMYVIGASLGPHTKKSSKFEFTSKKEKPITDLNLKEMSELFLEEGGRTGSISKHNVVLAVLGEDFAFQRLENWKDNYENYEEIFKYINENKDKYNAQVEWGSLKDYFKEIRAREKNFPTFKGDFFVYSDVIGPKNTLKKADYWSGYFSTRPFWKKFYRQAESIGRSAEIIFSFALSHLNELELVHLYGENYSLLKNARRNLALFAHHDGVPGVSDRRVMIDFGKKLLASIYSYAKVQTASISALLSPKLNQEAIDIEFGSQIPSNFGVDLIQNKILQFPQNNDKDFVEILIFNPLSWRCKKLIKIQIVGQNYQVLDSKNSTILSQISPIFTKNQGKLPVDSQIYELGFIAQLEALSLTKFTIKKCVDTKGSGVEKCAKKPTVIEEAKADQLYLKNNRTHLSFNGETGYLSKIQKFHPNEKLEMEIKAELSFGGYTSVKGYSGPYLFMQNGVMQKLPKEPELTKKYKIDGPIYSRVEIISRTMNISYEILHSEDQSLEELIYLENSVHIGEQDGEFFMRFDTDLESISTYGDPLGYGQEVEEDDDHTTTRSLFAPTFYTDQNGFLFEKRVKIESIGIEGNYYPVSTLAWIEDLDSELRLSLIVDRPQGVSSYAEGRLEAMVERRLLYDDDRGIGQGVTDNRPTLSKYILNLEKIEDLQNKLKSSNYATPTVQTQAQSQGLNYPPQVYFIKTPEYLNLTNPLTLLKSNGQLSEDYHLVNFRALASPSDENTPSNEFLAIVQRFGDVNSLSNKTPVEPKIFKTDNDNPNDIDFSCEFNYTIKKTDLTGLRKNKELVIKNLNNLTSKPFELTCFTINFNLD